MSYIFDAACDQALFEIDSKFLKNGTYEARKKSRHPEGWRLSPGETFKSTMARLKTAGRFQQKPSASLKTLAQAQTSRSSERRGQDGQAP